MKHTLTSKAAELMRKNGRHRRWRRAFSGMAAVVVFITTYMLILPAITMENKAICGMAEHTHTDACYEMQLVCTQEETPEGADVHVHGPECYEQQQVLTCTKQEGEGHAHTDACYGYVCGQEESSGHTHTDACYTEVTHRELTCTEPESAGHSHGDGCYDADGNLVCTEPESTGHTHGDSCYTETVTRELTCGQEESSGHTHTDACIGLICGQEEYEGHTHTDACYTTEDVLVCTEPTGHTHGDGCYEKVLVCDVPEHTHTEECYPAAEPEEPQEPELICTLPEHSHEDACYDADGNLICGMEEHTHTEECYAPVEIPEEETPTTAFPEEIPEGYVEYTFDNEAGLTVTAYAPEGAFGQDVQLFAEVLPEDSEEYAQAKENLDKAENAPEYTGMAAMDIRFVDAAAEDPAQAEEIEPDAEMGQVFVKIDAQALIPEDVDESTLAVQHHAKVSDGGIFGTGIFEHTDVVVETVADNTEETGDITAVPDETALPETLPALADEPEMAEAATLEEPAAETETEETQPAAMNVEAEFAVNSFSTFTITWGSSGRTVTLHYVDNRNQELDFAFAPTGSKTIAGDGDALLSDYAAPISGYVYRGAHLDRYNGTEAARVSYNASERDWFYTPADYPDYWMAYPNKSGSTRNVNVYLVYEVAKQPTEVDTVDSTSKGVYMYMFNYDAPAFDGATWYNFTGTKTGMTSNTTEGYGEYFEQFPNLNSRVPTSDYLNHTHYELSFPYGQSLSNFFSPENYNKKLVSDVREVNNLFLESVYNNPSTKGTFYYSSFENFATLVGLDGTDDVTDFKVYNTLGTPSSEDAFYYKRGNFMPYNGLNLEARVASNQYDEYGGALSSDDAAYDLPVYGLSDTADYYFGMYLYANFYQPKNGLYNNDEMVFYFNGDDDMWVYIDGVLVLDLGGCHDAQSGTINFTNGKVEWTHNSTPKNHGFDQETTILQRFKDAGKEESTRWDGATFADGTFHTIQVFYMERGAGASNLKMSFNLPTVPDGSLSVRKDVKNYFNAQMQDVSYEMQLLDAQGNPINTSYKLMGSDETRTTGEEGKFSLHHNETAVFEEIPGDANVTVKEIGVNPSDDHRLDELYNISCTVTNSTGQEITGTQPVEENGKVVGVTLPMPAAGTANVVIQNEATFTAPITVTKTFTNDGVVEENAPEDFEATFTVYEDGVEEPIGSVAYSEFEDGQYTFWLKENKTYRIVETIADGKEGTYGDNVYRYTTVTVQNGAVQYDTEATVNVPQGASTGNVITVEFDNVYGSNAADLTIIKNIYGLTEEQVEKLVEGEYRSDSGLRFDVDTFSNFSNLKLEEEKADNSKYYNYTDWTFNAADTLNSSGIVGNRWGQEITENPDGNSIDSDHDSGKNPNEQEHFGNSSLIWVADPGEELGGYWKYTVTISNIDISQNNIFRVWEQRLEVDGFKATASVEEYPTGQKDHDTITSWYEGNTIENHGNKATAFELTQDTTVEFTNRYTQGKLSITKDLTVDNVPVTTGTDHVFTFQIEIPAEWANSADANKTPIEYKVTYSRQSGEQTHQNDAITFDQNGSATIKLYAGETAMISLPTGIQPTVTEINHDGYAVGWTGELGSGSNTSATSGVTTAEIEADDPVEVTCTNRTGAVLPSTGGMGTTPFLALGTLLTLGAGMLLVQRRRKEGSDAV